MARHGGNQTGFRVIRKTASAAVVLAALLALAACAAGPGTHEIVRYVEIPSQWQLIDPVEADLTLPLVAPMQIEGLSERAAQSGTVEQIYTFEGITGYVKTSRIVSGTFTEDFADALGSYPDFKAHVLELRLPSGAPVKAPWPGPFLNGKFFAGKSLSRGFVSRNASARPRFTRCFVARTAYLMIGYESGKQPPDSVDTIVEALLCGDLPPQTDLEQMLVRVRTVEDRTAFRKALSN